jgi:NAD(P)-dependent dehydrogenase (short-subunit alcohol dehydrogenase family)
MDVCVNNASAIAVGPTEVLLAKKFDLMQDINVRSTFLLTEACLLHFAELAESARADDHPAVNTNPRWLRQHPAHASSKYGMTLLSLGCVRQRRHCANCQWPETYSATSAVANMPDGEGLVTSSGNPEIMGDAAVEIISRPARETTGNCHIDARPGRPAPARGHRRRPVGG